MHSLGRSWLPIAPKSELPWWSRSVLREHSKAMVEILVAIPPEMEKAAFFALLQA